jgi:hypothetical protein
MLFAPSLVRQFVKRLGTKLITTATVAQYVLATVADMQISKQLRHEYTDVWMAIGVEVNKLIMCAE